VGSVAYKLQLLEGSMIHPVFHISQLKPYSADYTPTLPVITDLEAADTVPVAVIERRLVKKGNSEIPQVKLIWVELPSTTTTWEDYNVVKQRFPTAPAWGQAGRQGGGGKVSHLMVARLARRTEEGRKHGEAVFSIYLAYLHYYVLYH
jgi:hypothetical protein